MAVFNFLFGFILGICFASTMFYFCCFVGSSVTVDDKYYKAQTIKSVETRHALKNETSSRFYAEGGGASSQQNLSDVLVDFSSQLNLPPPEFACRTAAAHPTFEICHWNPEQDQMVSAFIARDGVWEAQRLSELRLAWHSFSELPNFVDVGANLGLYTLAAASNKLTNIVAFEPLPPNVGLITAGILRNYGFAKNIRLFAAGAGEKRESMPFAVNLHNIGGSSFNPRAGNRIRPTHRQNIPALKIISLDSVIDYRVDVMKIDVEGFEGCVLKGGKRLFEHHGVLMLFIEIWKDEQSCDLKAVEYLRTLNYDWYPTFLTFAAALPPLRAPEVDKIIEKSSQMFDFFLIRKDIEDFGFSLERANEVFAGNAK